MSSQKLTNNSTHFSFLVLLCINKNSLKDFSVLKLLILIYVLNLKHRCFCCSNATEIAFLEMNVLACMPRNMLHSWWYVLKLKFTQGLWLPPCVFRCDWMLPLDDARLPANQMNSSDLWTNQKFWTLSFNFLKLIVIWVRWGHLRRPLVGLFVLCADCLLVEVGLTLCPPLERALGLEHSCSSFPSSFLCVLF